jgi:hypothetical protein
MLTPSPLVCGSIKRGWVGCPTARNGVGPVDGVEHEGTRAWIGANDLSLLLRRVPTAFVTDQAGLDQRGADAVDFA